MFWLIFCYLPGVYTFEFQEFLRINQKLGKTNHDSFTLDTRRIFFQKFRFQMFQWKTKISLISWLISSIRVKIILFKKNQTNQSNRSLDILSRVIYSRKHWIAKNRRKMIICQKQKKFSKHISHEKHNAK